MMKTISVNREIYSIETIYKTIDVYKNYADISFELNDLDVKLFFDKCRYDELLTVKEFENYMIGLENT